MTAAVDPETVKFAADILQEAARRPTVDVENCRFDGKTNIVDEEEGRLRAGAVFPTFKKAPRWKAAKELWAISATITFMPLLGILWVILIGNLLYLIILIPLLIFAIVGMAFLFFYWLAYHIMFIAPDNGRFGKADPDQAYKGLVLMIRDLVRTEAYGFKLTRYQAIIAHNYNFTIIPSEGSKERLHIVVYKRYNSPQLRIQNTRAAGEKRPTYLKFKNAIQERLARQVR